MLPLHGTKSQLFNLFWYIYLSELLPLLVLKTTNPIQVKNVEADILTGITFLPRSILTSTKAGHLKLWIRPLALRPRSKNTRPVDIDPVT